MIFHMKTIVSYHGVFIVPSYINIYLASIKNLRHHYVVSQILDLYIVLNCEKCVNILCIEGETPLTEPIQQNLYQFYNYCKWVFFLCSIFLKTVIYYDCRGYYL